MMLPVVVGPEQAGVIVKQKHDAFSNLLSGVVSEGSGAGWHEHLVHWPVLPPSGHQLLFRVKRKGFFKCPVQKPLPSNN